LAFGQAEAGCEGPPVQQPGWAVVFHYEVVKDYYRVKLLIFRLGKPNIALLINQNILNTILRCSLLIGINTRLGHLHKMYILINV